MKLHNQQFELDSFDQGKVQLLALVNNVTDIQDLKSHNNLVVCKTAHLLTY
jgi:hypothetical protein